MLTVPVVYGAVQAQEEDSSAVQALEDSSATLRLSDYRGRAGLRLGLNLADMAYSHDAVDRYSHALVAMPIGGLYVGSRLGKSNLAIGAEALYIGRGTKLNWLDVNYSMKAHYVDLRLPVSYSFFGFSDRWAPYLMAAPWVGMAFGGQIDYTAYEYPDGVSREITTANLKTLDYGVKAAVGVEWLTQLGKMPLVLAAEAGYNFGLANTFASREQIENIGNGNPSVIANSFFGAELWHESRHSRGIEVALRVSIPFGKYKEPEVDDGLDEAPNPLSLSDDLRSLGRPPMRPDTVFVVNSDTVKEDAYVLKDCYSIPEMSAFLTLGMDISDKRICLFDIKFDFDKYELRPESDKPLNEVLMLMKAHPNVSVAVYGHTDSIGTIEYNQRLSENRAQSVVDWLVEHGIDSYRIHAEGFGEEYPMDTNDTEEGRFHNRRVEFDVRLPKLRR